MRNVIKLLTFLAILHYSSMAFPNPIIGKGDAKASLDSLSNLNYDNLEEMVRNNTLGAASKPVMFTGEARIKITNYSWGDTSQTRAGYFELDRQRIAFSEGNESAVRLGMVVRPNGNTILWSKLGFNTTLVGHNLVAYTSKPGYLSKDVVTYYGSDPNYLKAQFLHDKTNSPIYLHEDMSAGIAIRYPMMSVWARMGNVLWVQASPLTIWKAQPRNFAWDYLPFEIEQPIERYYDYNIAKGVKEGRAAWNKKPFQGVQLESIQMPWGLYFNFLYAKFENYDNFEPEYVDYATDRGLAYSPLDGFTTNEEEYKFKGTGDTYRWFTHLRFAKDLSPNLTTSLNLNLIKYDKEYVKLGLQMPNPFNSKGSDLWVNSPGQAPSQTMFYADGLNFYKDNLVISNNTLFKVGKNDFNVDIAFSKVDSQFFNITFKGDTSAQIVDKVVLGDKRSTGFSPAFFMNIKSDLGKGILTTDIAYISKKFYSPFSFVAPHECIYPYGSNLLGAGKFVARGEASPYVPNLAGINLNYSLKMDDGHAKFNAGIHFQPEKGFDAVYFPYILNGLVLSQAIQASTTRWGNGEIDGAVGDATEGKDQGFGIGFNPYYHRLGLGNQVVVDKGLGDKGGMFADYLAAYEGFIAFKSAQDAYDANIAKAQESRVTYFGLEDSISYKDFIEKIVQDTIDYYKSQGYAVIAQNSGKIVSVQYLPDVNKNENLKSKKYTHNYSFDGTYNLANLIGMKRKLYANLYAAYFELSTNGTPTFNKKHDKVLLVGNILRSEIAYALTKQFYIIGLFGIENWFSNKSYMATGEYTVGDSTYTVVLPNAVGLYLSAGKNPDVPATGVKQVNIDYTDMVYGIGFDWDIMKRTTFHFRFSHNLHKDNAIKNELIIDRNQNVRTGIDVNGFEGNVISGEIKMWF